MGGARYFLSSTTKRCESVFPVFSASWDWALRKVVDLISCVGKPDIKIFIARVHMLAEKL
jgi:hypothetical protein